MLRWGGGKSASTANDTTTIDERRKSPMRLDTDEPDTLTATSSSADDPRYHSNIIDRDDQFQSPSSHDAEKTNENSIDTNDLPDNLSGNGDDDNNQRSPSPDSVQVDDDDGADHAEDPPIPWLPQNVHSTCEFTHVIKDYASKRESGCKKAEYSSTTVDEYGNRWRLIVYVNGNGRASNHHLSLFLQVADADDLPFGWKKAVSYVLTLEHPKGATLSYAKRNPDKTFKLCPKAIDWGWSQFITADRIQQEGFVSNNELVVRASVTVKSSSVSVDDEDAELYLKCAVEEGDVEAVQLCLEHGASVNCKFKDDLYTPLHTACSSGNSDGSMEVLNLLLEEGADGNASNKWKETPLLIAANNGHRAAVAALLRHGANPSLCSEAGWSALTFAAHKGYDDIVSLLLRAGAPANCPVTEDSSTPLHKACAGAKPGHLASVNLLLVAEADVHGLNKWRETPLLTAANHGQAGAVSVLLQAGADPCKCTDTGWSPLSIAAYKGHDEVVKLLLEEGAPTEEEDPTLSALLQAATKGLPDTVKLLLRHGADHTVTTKKGDTALSILVEQNLIDAAVEMVTVYNASIPRCSRDRKKVQRARLLINLRMKQLEQGDKHNGESLEDDDHDDDESGHSQNEERGKTQGYRSQSSVPSASKDSRRMKKVLSESAEERARAAEKALLLELELEESKAKKEKAEANSKRQKKKEKKEKERQQKLKEEQARFEKEERERLERDRKNREKEQKEREHKLLEQKEREQVELLEREKVFAQNRKEREGRQHRERQEQEREKTKTERHTKEQSPMIASGFHPRSKNSRSKTIASITPDLSRNNGTVAPKSPSITPNRRWEKQEIIGGDSPSPSQRNLRSHPPDGPIIPNGNSFVPYQNGLPQSTPMHHCGSSLNSEQNVGLDQFAGSSHHGIPRSGIFQSPSASFPIEHPAICLFRRDKVSEMITRCTQVLAAVNGALIKSVFYRWMVRASHDSAPFVDPIIPSWTEPENLVTFFQRQLITESRKNGSIPLCMEVLKESGRSIAMYCINLAHDLDHFRHQIENQLPGNWTDGELGMTVSDENLNGIGSVATVSWANRAQVNIPSRVFSHLSDKFNGPRDRFLAASFMAKMWYDTRSIITHETPMDIRFSPKTKQRAQYLAQLTTELFSDPFSVETGCAFWGTFEAVDRIFGGFKPFLKIPASDISGQARGLTLALLPLDPPVAAKYLQHMVDTLNCHEASNIPITFFVVAHSNCFHDFTGGLSVGDLYHLDPRLLRENQSCVRYAECLPGGEYTLHSGTGAGDPKICSTPSLLVVLQNSCAKVLSDLPDSSISDLIDTIMQPLSSQNSFPGPEAEIPPTFLRGLASNSSNQPAASYEYGAIGGTTLSQSFPPKDVNCIASRRGRLFELVDNGEEEVDDDIVAGVLENLGVGLFQGNNVSTEVDIEAISLMGFGEMANAGLSNQVHNRFNLS